MEDYVLHNLGWEPGNEGKGFILRPGANFPHMQGAAPLVWTWNTQGMKPTHDQMAVRATGNVPHGMLPDRTSFFHIQPNGGVYLHGSGRTLNDDDYALLKDADSNLDPVSQQPKVESDSYGHANRLLELLSNLRPGRWREIPARWRSK